MKMVCRICLEEELDTHNTSNNNSNYNNNEDNNDSEFVNFCKCKGHCEAMHLRCLKKWIRQKMNKKQEGMVTVYKINSFECELCREPYPLVYYKNNMKMALLDIQRPPGTYIILEQKDTNSKYHSFTLFVVDYDYYS